MLRMLPCDCICNVFACVQCIHKEHVTLGHSSLLPSVPEALQLIPDTCENPDILANALGDLITKETALLVQVVLKCHGLEFCLNADSRPETPDITWQFTMPVVPAELQKSLSVWKICKALSALSAEVCVFLSVVEIPCDWQTALQAVLRPLPGMQIGNRT